MIYHAAALSTGIDQFNESANYWLKVSNDFGNKTNVPGGFDFRDSNGNRMPNFSLLEGISGVGLCLLALIQEELAGWERGIMIQ